MPRVPDLFRFVLIAIARWMNQRQLHIIEYVGEKNRVLCEQLGGRRVLLIDDQRRKMETINRSATMVVPSTCSSAGLSTAFMSCWSISAMIRGFMAKIDGRQIFPATDERRPVEFLDRTGTPF